MGMGDVRGAIHGGRGRVVSWQTNAQTGGWPAEPTISKGELDPDTIDVLAGSHGFNLLACSEALDINRAMWAVVRVTY